MIIEINANMRYKNTYFYLVQGSAGRTYWCKTIVKVYSHKFHISHSLHRYTSREELGTAKLFVGVARMMSEHVHLCTK